MLVPYEDGISLEIAVMGLIDKINPTEAREVEDISCELHQHIEIAIQDVMEAYDFGKDYEAQY